MEIFYELEAENRKTIFFKRKTNIGANPHFHSAIELLFVQEGEFFVCVDGKETLMHANDACFVDSFLLHQYEWAHKGICYVISADAEVFKEIFKTLKGVPPTFFTFGDFDLLDRLYELCWREYKDEATRYMAFAGALKMLFSQISQNVIFSQPVQKKDSLLVCQALQYAEQNLTGDLSLQAVARHFGYSYEHFSRILHMHLFENWNTYVNRLRVRRAHALLQQRKEGGASVLQIAYDCGFGSAKTFYRSYKKEFGEAPCKKSKK